MGKTLLGIGIGVLLAGAVFIMTRQSPPDASLDLTRLPEQRRAAGTSEASSAETQIESQDGLTPGIQPEADSLADSEMPLAQTREGPARNLQTMPAIPTLPDFEIDLRYINIYENGFTVPELLAAEPRDDRWALGTESFLRAEALSSTTALITRVQTECRTTWCGVVIEVPESIPGEDRHAMFMRIWESVGASDGRDFIWGRPTDSGGHITFYYRVDR